MSIKKKTINDSFTYNAANETEVTQMVDIDTAVGIRLECAAILSGHEKSIVWVEHLFREDGEKFTR